MEASEVSLTCKKQEKITGCEVWGVGSVRNHFYARQGQEILNMLRYVRACYQFHGSRAIRLVERKKLRKHVERISVM